MAANLVQIQILPVPAEVFHQRFIAKFARQFFATAGTS
jgi:hypothetical protein